jgi:hypothetical protein
MKLRKNVAVSESGLVFNPVNGESFTVNPIGIEILDLLRQEKSGKEITGQLVAKYAMDPATVDKDLADFTGLLSSYNLLEHEEKKA